MIPGTDARIDKYIDLNLRMTLLTWFQPITKHGLCHGIPMNDFKSKKLLGLCASSSSSFSLLAFPSLSPSLLASKDGVAMV